MDKQPLEDLAAKGQEAKSVLNHPLFKEARQTLEGYIEDQMQSCDPGDEKKALRLILMKQWLGSFMRTFEYLIEDGENAQEQLEKLINFETKPILNREIVR